MKFSSAILFTFLIMTGMCIAPTRLAAVNPGEGIKTAIKQEGTLIKNGGRINEEDNRPGKKEMKIDGLSLAAYISTTAGLASLFIFPVLAIGLIPLGTILGLFAWRSRKRYEYRRGRGLAIASALVGGAFALLIVGSFIAFFLTGGF